MIKDKEEINISESHISLLVTGSAALPSLILIVIGILIHYLQTKKFSSCTAETKGTIIRNESPGLEYICPVVQYIVDGKKHDARKKFYGLKTKSISLPKVKPELYEDEKG